MRLDYTLIPFESRSKAGTHSTWNFLCSKGFLCNQPNEQNFPLELFDAFTRKLLPREIGVNISECALICNPLNIEFSDFTPSLQTSV